MTPEAQLARFALSAEPTAAARAIMRLSLIDWAACAVAGTTEPVSRILRGHVAGEGQGATLVGGGQAGPARAALANGTTSHALDYDDTHFAHIGHPSVAVIPAALAIGETAGADLGAILDAALVGAEASVRVGVWLGRGHYEAGFHQTATAGAFGATLAACRLLGLTEGQAVTALGLAATRASGLKSQFGTMGKPMNAGLAAETGVESALLAQRGMTSANAGVSGPQGFGPTHHGSGDTAAFDGIGETWLMETVSHKFHACCHGLHAMLEAMAALRDRVETTKIDRIVITTHPRWMKVCNIVEPAAGLEAKFSFRLTAAMALSGVETAAIASYTDEVCQAPELIALRDKVRVETDDQQPETATRVAVHQGDETLTAMHDLDAPMPIKARADRIEAKAAALLGVETSRSIISAIDQGDQAAFLMLMT